MLYEVITVSIRDDANGNLQTYILMENRNFLKIKAKNEWLYRWLGIVSLGLFLSVMFA